MRWLSALLALLLAACAGAPLPSERVRRNALLEPPEGAMAPPAGDEGHPDAAPVSQERRDRTDVALASVDGKAIAATAASLVGSRTGSDCSTFVRAVFARHGVDLFAEGSAGDNGVRSIWRLAQARGAVHHRERPDPGDVVFFDDSYDRNRDGRRNDPLTHVGIVESVESDGTVVFIHRLDRGVVRSRMNLEEPGLRTVKGHVLNDYLREGSARSGSRLTGSLFAGFATLAGG